MSEQKNLADMPSGIYRFDPDAPTGPTGKAGDDLIKRLRAINVPGLEDPDEGTILEAAAALDLERVAKLVEAAEKLAQTMADMLDARDVIRNLSALGYDTCGARSTPFAMPRPPSGWPHDRHA